MVLQLRWPHGRSGVAGAAATDGQLGVAAAAAPGAARRSAQLGARAASAGCFRADGAAGGRDSAGRVGVRAARGGRRFRLREAAAPAADAPPAGVFDFFADAEPPAPAGPPLKAAAKPAKPVRKPAESPAVLAAPVLVAPTPAAPMLLEMTPAAPAAESVAEGNPFTFEPAASAPSPMRRPPNRKPWNCRQSSSDWRNRPNPCPRSLWRKSAVRRSSC